MSFAETIKGLMFKKKPDNHEPSSDPRRNNESITGGRRNGESENPYLSARRTWNEHVGSVVAQRQTWQVIGILSMLIALAGVGGVIHIGSQSKFVPYIIEVDKLGQTVAAGTVQATNKTDPRAIHASVAEFITDARMVSPDVALQRKAIYRAYAKLSPNDPATAKMNEWLNGSEEASPFRRASKEMVSIEIKSALPQTPDTWQVDWVETIRDRQGTLKAQPTTMRALVTIYTAEMTTATTEDQIRMNPLGIYMRDFSWSRLQ